jgi:hypothetical protein
MIRYGLVSAVWIATTALSDLSVRAASSIYHSAPQNLYGWCAGYSAQQDHRCAEAECKRQGGTQCRFAAGCQRYGATAFAERPARGFGAGCAETDESARRLALIGCISASNMVCWTNVAFTPSGSKATPESNLSFDQVWFAQLMLQSLRIDGGPSDGVLSEKTSSAIRTFQNRIGRSENGALDAELMQRLFDAVGGPSNFAYIVKRDLLPSIEKQLSERGATNRFYYTALEPLQTAGAFQDLQKRSAEARNLALATYLSARNSKCTLPATSAVQMADSVWSVTCAEATYTLVINESGYLITKGPPDKGK